MSTGWPNTFEAPSAAARASKSLAPPAAKGTMNLTGLLGQLLAGLVVCAQLLKLSPQSKIKARLVADFCKMDLRVV
jgi:hypothetical protein